MRTACPAKVNLRLRVFSRDETGYHAVETILARTDLADEVEIEETDSGMTLELEGPAAGGVTTGPDNLCLRAAGAFLSAAFPRRRPVPGLRIRLVKRIPAGSGLGGGSSDAAGVLRLLAARWPRVEPARLYELAGELGTDIAFGLLDVPMALGWERGRRLMPLRPPAARPGLLLTPPFAVATPEAYGWLAETRAGSGSPARAAALPGTTRLASWDGLERLVANDLAAVTFEKHPALARAVEMMQDSEGTASMTGSGSTLFAIFADVGTREDAQRALAESGFGREEGWTTHEIRLPV